MAGLWRKPPGAGSARGRKRRKGAKPVRRAVPARDANCNTICLLPSEVACRFATPGNAMTPIDRLRASTVVDGQPALELGSLDDIRGATKGGMDPSGALAARLDLTSLQAARQLAFGMDSCAARPFTS